MRILYVINTGLIGGMQRHVLCLMESLRGVAETAVAINTEIDPAIIPFFENAGEKVYRLYGKSGHDWRIMWRFRDVLRDFEPDVVHAHGIPLFVLLSLFVFARRIPLLHSLHTPPRRPSVGKRLPWKLLEWRVAYWLPVSSSTWERFKALHHGVRGEVFFNPMRLHNSASPRGCDGWKDKGPVVGMVGRNADQKDWPSFHAVEKLVKAEMPEVQFLNAGEEAVCDGRAAISKMDVFVMTSKHEQLPTTMLECFALGTPICGFLPDGGTSDVLAFSNGAVRGAFIDNRDCAELARLVRDLLSDSSRRLAIVEDGWRILTDHFDADKNCRGQLMDIYRRFTK